MKLYANLHVYTTWDACDLLARDKFPCKRIVYADQDPWPALLEAAEVAGIRIQLESTPDKLTARVPALIRRFLRAAEVWDKDGVAIVHQHRETAYTIAHLVAWHEADMEDDTYSYDSDTIAPCYRGYSYLDSPPPIASM